MRPTLELASSFKDESQSFDKIWQHLLSDVEKNDIGFFNLPETDKYVQSCQDLLNKYSKKSHFVQIGIGGSSLGPKMLVSALTSLKDQRKVSFWENIDSDLMQEEFDTLKIQETLFFVVSKSGGTAETLALLCLLLEKMKAEGIDKNDYNKHIVVATGIKGDLLAFAESNKLDILEVPENVGGRFSVLTPVGLLPAMFAGVDGAKLLKGASDYRRELVNDSATRGSMIALSNELLSLQRSKNISQTILMPYSSKLKELTAWFARGTLAFSNTSSPVGDARIPIL